MVPFVIYGSSGSTATHTSASGDFIRRQSHRLRVLVAVKCHPVPIRWLAVLLVGLIIWSATDVRARACLDPSHTATHRTDFTVYTAAGAAFFDGHDPYQVANARGWHYLYLPLFAILVAPLAKLPPEWQAMTWFWISVAAGWGTFLELKRLRRHVATLQVAGERVVGMSSTTWSLLAVAAVTLPTLNSLQRGQVGLAQLYLTLLAFRLWTERRSNWLLVAAGFLFAQAVVLKLSPLVPVACLAMFDLLQVWGARSRVAVNRLSWSGVGLTVGLVSGVLLVPAAFVGWQSNLRHLSTWWTTVGNHTAEATYDQFAGDSHSARNQSLANALWLFGNGVQRLCHANASETPAGAPTAQMAMDSTAARTAIDAARAVVALSTLLAIWRLSADNVAGDRQEDANSARRATSNSAQNRAETSSVRSEAICFALGCNATLLLPSIARAHYYMAWLPALLWIPPWLAMRHSARAAMLAAIIPAVLTIAHYAMMHVAGNFGLLGIGAALWHLAVIFTLLRRNQAAARIDNECDAIRPARAA